jgi:excisionase family DNA binding protein
MQSWMPLNGTAVFHWFKNDHRNHREQKLERKQEREQEQEQEQEREQEQEQELELELEREQEQEQELELEREQERELELEREQEREHMTKRQRKKIECEYWSVCEYAQLIGLCAQTVYRRIKTGEIPAIKIGGSWRIRKIIKIE